MLLLVCNNYEHAQYVKKVPDSRLARVTCIDLDEMLLSINDSASLGHSFVSSAINNNNNNNNNRSPLCSSTYLWDGETSNLWRWCTYVYVHVATQKMNNTTILKEKLLWKFWNWSHGYLSSRCTCTCTCIYKCTCIITTWKSVLNICLYIYMYIQCTCTYVHICTYTYMYIRICSYVCILCMLSCCICR